MKKFSFVKIQNKHYDTLNAESYTQSLNLYTAIECILSKQSAISGLTISIISTGSVLYIAEVYGIVTSSWDTAAFTEKRYRNRILNNNQLKDTLNKLIELDKLTIYIRNPSGNQIRYSTSQSINCLIEAIKQLDPDYDLHDN